MKKSLFNAIFSINVPVSEREVFFEAKIIVLIECIKNNETSKIELLRDVVKHCETKQVKKLETIKALECKVLADALINKKEFLTTNTELHATLFKILESQYKSIQDTDLKSSVAEKIAQVRQNVQKVTGEISELKVYNARKIDELKQEILKLKNRNTQKVADNKIKFFGLEDKGKNFAVECKIVDADSTDKSQCIVFGRPPIAESATKQQRHITPYSFLESIVDKYTNDLVYTTVEESRIQLLELIRPMQTLVSFTSSGLGFTKQDFVKLQKLMKASDKQDVQTWLQITTKLGLDNRDYYLVHKSISKCVSLTDFKEKSSSAQSLYQEKMKKLLQYTIEGLSKDIIHYDSMSIINESLVKLVLILLNTRSDISLPNDKGHSLDYSIRLYDTICDAKKDKDTGFRTVTSDELYKLCRSDTKIDQRIRIVKDEGAVVKATIESLKKISQIMQLLNYDFYDVAQESLTDYNKLIEGRKVLQEYAKQLTIPDIANTPNTTKDQKTAVSEKIISMLYTTNIPLHLYHVFDFKPLEKQILVPLGTAQKDGMVTLFVHKGDKLEEYCFQDSTTYRGKGVPLERDTIFLVHKVVDHVVTSILAFFDFKEGRDNNLQLLKGFSSKIATPSTGYNINMQKYQEEFDKYYKEYDIFNVVSPPADETTSYIIGVSEQLND